MSEAIGKIILCLLGLWLIYGGGACIFGTGFNSIFALFGLGIIALGVWMLTLAFKPDDKKDS